MTRHRPRLLIIDPSPATEGGDGLALRLAEGAWDYGRFSVDLCAPPAGDLKTKLAKAHAVLIGLESPGTALDGVRDLIGDDAEMLQHRPVGLLIDSSAARMEETLLALEQSLARARIEPRRWRLPPGPDGNAVLHRLLEAMHAWIAGHPPATADAMPSRLG